METQPALEFRLLGPVAAMSGGTALRLGGRRQRALLALLLIDVGRPVPSERLADELWQGDPPPGAATTIRAYASRLRSVLGQDSVVSEAGGYRLDARREAVDAYRFESLLGAGSAALAHGSAGLAAERLHAALALWHGSALADTHDHGTLAAEARRLEELRLTCVAERIDADLALGRHAALVPELQALVREVPLRERLWRQLALAQYHCGRQADALATLREARDVLDRELGLEPGRELQQLEIAILRHEVPASTPERTRNNLPAPTTSFVGRDRELAALADLLRTHRLVTITGLGGCGKTRLALEIGDRQRGTWADGVWLVDLSAVADGALVARAVASALGVATRASGEPVEELSGHLASRELLLLLDNCEHLVGPCAELVEVLLRAAPTLRILATSRVPLAVAGECDFALDPLPAPGDDARADEIAQAPAVRLFVDRAAAVRREAAGTAETLALAGRICRELDGLPLAIELAAARVKSLSLAEIAERLRDRFRFLRAWQRVSDPRHRTLLTAMDWSYDLLGAAEQELLARLAVFVGAARFDAIAEVCVGGDHDTADDLLARLVDASLVHVEPGAVTQYRLLETVREYAATKLAERPDADAVRRAHAEYFLHLADAANLSIEAIGHGPQEPEPVLREQHNLRAAIDWATDADVELAARLMLALENFWITQAVEEGERRFARLLERADALDTVLRARVTRDHGGCVDVMQDFAAARTDYERSQELFRQAGDEVGVAYLDFRLGIVAICQGQVDEAHRLYESSLADFRRLHDRSGEMQALGNLGEWELTYGDVERGKQLLETALAMGREVGWWWWVESQGSILAEVAIAAGQADEAERHAREFLSIAWGIGDLQESLLELAILARAAALRGEDERALRLWASVAAVEDRPGRFGRFERAEYAACMPPGPLPDPLPLADAVALALS